MKLIRQRLKITGVFLVILMLMVEKKHHIRFVQERYFFGTTILQKIF